MEDELIKEILLDIKKNKLKTKKEIDEEKKIILNNIYDKFMYYEINKTNKKNTYDNLKGYKYINYKDLNDGDYIKFLNEKYFYNITINKGGFISNINDDFVEIINNNNYNKIKIDENIFFKKIEKDEEVKLMILENISK